MDRWRDGEAAVSPCSGATRATDAARRQWDRADAKRLRQRDTSFPPGHGSDPALAAGRGVLWHA
jgi:hypothetical protein